MSGSTTTKPPSAPPDTPVRPGAPDGGWRSFKRLLRFWGPFRVQVATSALLAFVIVAAKLLIPYQTGAVVDDLRAGAYGDIRSDVLRLLGAAIVIASVGATRRIVAGTISLGIEKQLRDQLFSHLSSLGLRYFDRQQTGQLLSRVTSDVSSVRFFLGYGLTYFFMHVATLVAVPIMLVSLAPRMALVVVVLMPLLTIASVRYSRRSHPLLRELQQRVAEVTAHGEETLVGARVVRAFGQEQREVARFRSLTGEVVAQERRAMLVKVRYGPLYNLIPNVALAAVVLMAGSLVPGGSVSLGQFIAFYGYIVMLTAPLRILGSLLGRAQRATASGDRLWELLDADERIPERDDPLALPPRSTAGSEVRFEGVTFAYRDGRPVLDGVDLVVPAGSTVALLGPTGCGKTTLASLLPRFYDPDRGRVLIDGIDVRDLELHELRRAIGIVDQEPFLFSASIAENLRYGRPDATDDDLRRALDAAQASEFVDRLPEGIDTVVGERGLTLSGGQRQRLAIARALVVDPRVLILDDATASVDSRVESRISDAIGATGGGSGSGRTTIIIAHRPSTIALADHVVIMRDGAIEDEGSHEELLARSHTYQLVHEQRAVRREFLIDPAQEAAAQAATGGPRRGGTRP